MKKVFEVAKDKLKKVTTRETPNEGIVAGERGSPGKHRVIEEESYYKASNSGEKVNLAFEPELEQKSYTTSEKTKTQLGAAGTDNSPVKNARVIKKKTAFGVIRRYNTGAPNTPQVTKLKTSQEKQKSRSGSPIEQLERSIKSETQEIGNNPRAGEKKKVLQGKVEQKIPDDEKAVPGRIRSIEGNLPAAASSPNLSRHSILENLSTIGKQGEESKKQEVATLSEGTEVIRNMREVVDSLSQSLLENTTKKNQEKGIIAPTKFKQISIFSKSIQNLQEKPDSHDDSDSGVDLPGANSEQISESTINTSVLSGSAEHVEEIADSFNPLIEECDSELSRLKKLQVEAKQECRIRSISFSSSTESLNSILSAEEEVGAMQSDNEDELNEKESEILQAKQEPQIQLGGQIALKKTAQEPVSANKETPIKKQSSDRSPNVTLAICYSAACCCFIAAAFKGSLMLLLIGTAFLITAVVIEWKTPSRELTSPNPSPFINDKAMAKT